MHKTYCAAILALAASAGVAQASITLAPLASFGTSGTITASGATPYLTTSGDNTRSIAYNPVTGNLYVAYRNGGAPNIQILNGTTGAASGTLFTSGITANTGFTINCIRVTSDGAIYADDVDTDTNTVTFDKGLRVWRYSSETAAKSANPTLIFDNQIGRGGQRWGDTMDVRGTGANTQFLFGSSTNLEATLDPSQSDSVVLLTVNDATFSSSTSLTANPSLIGNDPANKGYPEIGDYRSGIAFGPGNTFFGKCGPQVSPAIPAQNLAYASFDPSTLAATQLDSISPSSPNSDAINMSAIAVDNTDHLLAGLVGNQTAGATAEVLLYDISDPENPVFLTSESLVNTYANQFQVGDIQFGSDGTLYVLNTDNSIQAFSIQGLPEPATMGIVGMMILLNGRRRHAATGMDTK